MVLKLLTAVAVIYGALAVVLFAFQPRMVFQPNFQGRALDATPDAIGLDYRDVSIATDDGETLHGWWVPHADARATMLFSHGNAGNISHRLESLRQFHRLRLNVLIYDYRGYGQSTGKPGEQGLYRDIDAAWRWLIDKRALPTERIVLFGRSLGGAVTARLATRVEPACVVLESTFTSVPDLGAELYPWLPVRLLSRVRLDARSAVPGITAPLLIIHSRDDEIIPWEHARKLQAAAGDSAEILAISGGHNTGFLDSERTYVEGLDGFLAGCLGGQENRSDR